MYILRQAMKVSIPDPSVLLTERIADGRNSPLPVGLGACPREVVICWGEVEVARTRRALRVLETSHPPTYYLPWDDLAKLLLEPASGASFCEWKRPRARLDYAGIGRSVQGRAGQHW